MNAIKNIKGTHDILPGEVCKWQELEKIVRNICRQFGYHEIRTPVFEETRLFSRTVGEDTDIVSKEMYTWKDRDGKSLTLRPELTASVARSYIQHNLNVKAQVQRLYYIGALFRRERPQKGRQRQFHQFGVEVIGTDAPAADVEVIAFMMRIYQRIGIKNFELKLNSVGDPESREGYKQALKDFLAPNLDKLSEVSQKRFEKNPMRILDSKEPEDQEFIKQAPVIQDYLNEESTQHFKKVCEALDALGINYTIDPYLVRGMDYYTRTAFELTSPDLGSQDALAGGGRYDLLVEEIGGQPTPAVGFAAGMERLLIACDELDIKLADDKKVDVYIVSLGEKARDWALTHLSALREAGISATMDYQGRSMKAQMKDANRENAHYTLIVGENELEAGEFTLRNMKESDEQSLSFANIIEKLS